MTEDVFGYNALEDRVTLLWSVGSLSRTNKILKCAHIINNCDISLMKVILHFSKLKIEL